MSATAEIKINEKSTQGEVGASLEQIQNNISTLNAALKEAKEQFKKASIKSRNNAGLWIFFTIGIIIASIVYAKSLLEVDPKIFKDIWTWQIVYYTAIRITVLSGLIFIITFFINMVKAHLHIHYYSKHRERLTNSMASLIEAGKLSSEYKEIILSKLIDIITEFKESGIINEPINAPNNISLDLISKLIDKKLKD